MTTLNGGSSSARQVSRLLAACEQTAIGTTEVVAIELPRPSVRHPCVCPPRSSTRMIAPSLVWDGTTRASFTGGPPCIEEEPDGLLATLWHDVQLTPGRPRLPTSSVDASPTVVVASSTCRRCPRISTRPSATGNSQPSRDATENAEWCFSLHAQPVPCGFPRRLLGIDSAPSARSHCVVVHLMLVASGPPDDGTTDRMPGLQGRRFLLTPLGLAFCSVRSRRLSGQSIDGIISRAEAPASGRAGV